MNKELKQKLGIDEYLELLKEDNNYLGAYISFGQYIYILEQRIEKAIEYINKNSKAPLKYLTGYQVEELKKILVENDKDSNYE